MLPFSDKMPVIKNPMLTRTRILVIDDEPRWLNFVRDDLGTMFEVEVATNLKMTLTKLKDNRYELIIVSSRCSDVLQALNKKYPDKRVVVATGQPTTYEAINVYRLGALDYFAKDLRCEVISKRIDEAIQKPLPAYKEARQINTAS